MFLISLIHVFSLSIQLLGLKLYILLNRHVNLLKVLLVHLYSFLEVLPLACDWYALSILLFLYFIINLRGTTVLVLKLHQSTNVSEFLFETGPFN